MKEAILLDAVNAASNQTSVQFDLGDLINYSIQNTFSSGTLNGSLALLGSMDNVTYATIENSAKTVTSGGAVIYSVEGAGYRYVKVQWTNSSGTGTITSKIYVKEPQNRF